VALRAGSDSRIFGFLPDVALVGVALRELAGEDSRQ